MSVSFFIVGVRMPLEEQLRFNFAHANAGELLDLVGLRTPDLCGQVRSRDLRQRITRVLEAGLEDGPRPTRQEGRVIWCGQPAGRREERLRALLDLCALAGELGVIAWA